MRRILLALYLCFAMVLPAAAEEFTLKDGTKIVGHMISLTGDTIEVETTYGKMQLKRSEILTINFPENKPAAESPATAAGKGATTIDDSLVDTLYTNKTAKFSLTVPSDWMIKPELRSGASVVAGLSSRDSMRFLLVARENYSASLESYEGLVEIQARQHLDSYERVLESHITIDGQSALLLSYRGVSAKAGNLPIQFLVTIIPVGNTITRLSAWCVEPLFNESQPTFEKILNSYHSIVETPLQK
jgi:hypothetical protein